MLVEMRDMMNTLKFHVPRTAAARAHAVADDEAFAPLDAATGEPQRPDDEAVAPLDAATRPTYAKLPKWSKRKCKCDFASKPMYQYARFFIDPQAQS